MKNRGRLIWCVVLCLIIIAAITGKIMMKNELSVDIDTTSKQMVSTGVDIESDLTGTLSTGSDATPTIDIATYTSIYGFSLDLPKNCKGMAAMDGSPHVATGLDIGRQFRCCHDNKCEEPLEFMTNGIDANGSFGDEVMASGRVMLGNNAFMFYETTDFFVFAPLKNGERFVPKNLGGLEFARYKTSSYQDEYGPKFIRTLTKEQAEDIMSTFKRID